MSGSPKMDKEKSTPRPWFADPDHREGYEWNIHILQQSDPSMRVCFMSNGEASEANAALIVSAVNAYDAHRACVEALKEIAGGWVPDYCAQIGSDDSLIDAEAAIVSLQKHAKAALAKLEQAG